MPYSLTLLENQIVTTSGDLVNWVNGRLTSVSGALPDGVDKDLLVNQSGQWIATTSGVYEAASGTHSAHLSVGSLVYANTSSGNVGFGNATGKAATFIDSLGRVSIGGGNITGVNRLQIDHSGTTNKTETLASSVFEIDAMNYNYSDFVFRLSASSGWPVFSLARSRGTLSAPTIVNKDDSLGAFWFLGYDSNSWEPAASIDCLIDDTPGNGDMPGRLEFRTTPNGTHSQVTRMTIKSTGRVGINTTTPSEILTVSGNITSASGIFDEVNLRSLSSDPPPSEGDRWYRNDKDFRAKSNGVTFVDGMVNLVQVYQTTGITAQDCNGAGGVAIEWNAQSVVDTLYGHSTSTNRSRITVSGTAWYKVSYAVSWQSANTTRKTIKTQLRKNGATYLIPGLAYSESYNGTDAESTNFASSLHRLSSGDYVEVIASRAGSAGVANTLQDGSTYIMLEFVRWSN